MYSLPWTRLIFVHQDERELASQNEYTDDAVVEEISSSFGTAEDKMFTKGWLASTGSALRAQTVSRPSLRAAESRRWPLDRRLSWAPSVERHFHFRWAEVWEGAVHSLENFRFFKIWNCTFGCILVLLVIM
jgi:hypothetical protein